MLLSGVCLEIQDIDPFQNKSSFFSLISTQSSPKGFETRPLPSREFASDRPFPVVNTALSRFPPSPPRNKVEVHTF